MTDVTDFIRFFICHYNDGTQKVLKVEKATWDLKSDDDGNFVQTVNLDCHEATEEEKEEYEHSRI